MTENEGNTNQPPAKSNPNRKTFGVSVNGNQAEQLNTFCEKIVNNNLATNKSDAVYKALQWLSEGKLGDQKELIAQLQATINTLTTEKSDLASQLERDENKFKEQQTEIERQANEINRLNSLLAQKDLPTNAIVVVPSDKLLQLINLILSKDKNKRLTAALVLINGFYYGWEGMIHRDFKDYILTKKS